ncbi:hypothetical protein ES705_16580 [subsurface metagenome]
MSCRNILAPNKFLRVPAHLIDKWRGATQISVGAAPLPISGFGKSLGGYTMLPPGIVPGRVSQLLAANNWDRT